MDQADNQRKNTGRDNFGRFAEGNAGRPLGAKGKISREALESVKSMKDDAIQRLRGAVASGERWAVEYVLSRVLPEHRAIELEGMTADDIRTAIKMGDISPDEAKALANVAKNLGEMEMLEAIHARVKELETLLMTLHKRSLLLRLQKVEGVIRPRGSKKAKIAAMSDSEKAVYEQWKKDLEQWHSKYPGEAAYIAVIDQLAGKGGTPPPKMPVKLQKELFPDIKISGDAQRDYDNYRESLMPEFKPKRSQ